MDEGLWGKEMTEETFEKCMKPFLSEKFETLKQELEEAYLLIKMLEKQLLRKNLVVEKFRAVLQFYGCDAFYDMDFFLKAKNTYEIGSAENEVITGSPIFDDHGEKARKILKEIIGDA